MNPGRLEAGVVAAVVASGFVLYGLGAMLVLWIRDVRLRQFESRRHKGKANKPDREPTD
jgi:hypothetical protein